jgi:hypothetical protein
MNAVFNAELLFSVIGFQNKLLGGQKREWMGFKEYRVFLLAFLGLCCYCYILTDVLKHP